MKTTIVAGQPSFAFASDRVQAFITELGGMLAPVRFRIGKREIEPFSIPPWAGEPTAPDTPPLLQALRGDFFCAPFGANVTPYRGEQHPCHGEVANAKWQFESLDETKLRSTLHLSIQPRVREGRIDKWIELRKGETNLYCRHRISGMQGAMSLGHHAMLKFNEEGLISTSRLLLGKVAPVFEIPSRRGYQSLLPDAEFSRLNRVPTLFGGYADLSRYPARQGYEDLVMLVHESQPDFAWTAVTFPEAGYVWFALKDPRILRSTVMWISNGGRHYPPWNGHHLGVLGLEDVTAYFAEGLAASASSNRIKRRGYPSSVKLSPAVPFEVPYIMGIAALPKGFDRVKSISRQPQGILISSTKDHKLKVTVDHHFLNPHETQRN